MRFLFMFLLLAGFSSIQAIAEIDVVDELIQQPAVAEHPSEPGAISPPNFTPSTLAPLPQFPSDPVRPKQKISSDALCEQYGYGKNTEEYKLCIGYAEETGYSRKIEEGNRKKKRRREF